MKYKLLLLDIDGTLRPGSCERVPKENAEAVCAVQKAGVKIAIATGRGRIGVGKGLLRSIRPDYWVCAGGAQLVDYKGADLALHRLTTEEMYALVDLVAAAAHDDAGAFVGQLLCRSAGGGFCGLPPGGRMDAGRSPDPAAAEGVPPALRLCPASGPVPDGTAVPVGSGGPSCQPDPDFSGPTEAEGAQCGPNGACFFTAGRMIKRRRFS